MRTKLLFLRSAFLLSLWSQNALAQLSDVCCVMGKKAGENAETLANVRSPEECKTGSASGDYKVCSAKADPNNECSMMGDKERCQACNFFWAGKTCLIEDPVKKAKQELKKEQEEKEKKAKARKKSDEKSPPPEEEEKPVTSE
jgi:hypothetical protein